MNPAIEILLEKLLKTADFLTGETPKKIYLSQLGSLHTILKDTYGPDEVKIVYRTQEVIPHDVDAKIASLERAIERERRGKSPRRMEWEDKEGLRLQSLDDVAKKWPELF